MRLLRLFSSVPLSTLHTRTTKISLQSPLSTSSRPERDLQIEKHSIDGNIMSARTEWQPSSLQPTVLITIMLFTISVIAAVQVLRYYTAIDQGFAFASAGDGTSPSFSAFATFGYLYFPTILAVLFSMFWTWVDLDVKRLEPFYQMARSQGATLENSLTLQYPFDYVAFVPLRAARRRHWSVFLSGSIAVLIFWAITPLQNSMISTQQVSRSITMALPTVKSLPNINASFAQLDTSLIQNAWATLWYNQSLPAFATNASAFAPLDLTSLPSNLTPHTNMTAPSTRYWTSLDCTPTAQYIREPVEASTRTYASKGDGCEVDMTEIYEADLNATLGTPYNPYSGQGFYCGQVSADGTCTFHTASKGCESHQHTVLIGWTSHNTTFDIVSQFCEIRYWQQEGNLTVSAKDGSYQDFASASEPTLLDPNDFDTALFEQIIASGVNKNGPLDGVNQTLTSTTGNATAINALESWAHYELQLGQFDTNQGPMFGFVYGLMSPDFVDFSDFMNPDLLVASFEQAHQFLFALTMSQQLSLLRADSHISVQLAVYEQAVYLVDPLAWIVQAFLAAVTLLAAGLLISSWKRPTSLDRNPDSLSELSRLLEPEFIAGAALNRQQFQTKQDSLIPKTARFVLHCTEKCAGPMISVLNADDLHDNNGSETEGKATIAKKRHLPFHLSPLCGLLFTSILCSGIALLACLQSYSDAHQGLPLPSDNAVVQQLLLNYIPIIFATFIEPFWTLMNRSLCLLQPFMELITLRAEASSSLRTRYSSLPPQVLFFRAFRNRHFLLAAICLVAISCNVLAVSLGALFNIGQITAPVAIPATARSQALFDSPSSIGLTGLGLQTTGFQLGQTTAFQDHFYVAQSNITQGTSLPPWTTKDFFFIPQDFVSSDANEYTVATRGFGIRTHCNDISQDINNGVADFQVMPDTTVRDSYHVITQVSIKSDGRFMNCTTPVNEKFESAYSFVNGTAAWESFNVLADPVADRYNLNNASDVTLVSPCTDMFAISYGRTNNATTLEPDAAHDAGASAPYNASNDPNFGGNGPCHTAGCRGEKRDDQRPNVFPLNITSKTNLVCQTYVTTGSFDVNVDKYGRVLSYQNNSKSVEDPATYFQSQLDMHELILRMNALLTANAQESSKTGYTPDSMVLHNTTVGRQWLPYLIMLASNSGSTLDPAKDAPSPEELIPLLSNSTALLGSILLSLYHEQILPFANPTGGAQNMTTFATGHATYMATQSKVFLDPTMYAMTMTLLAIHLVAAIVFYCIIPRDVLSSLPTSLADQLGFFEGSTLIEDREWKPDWRYGYGRFIGPDGKPRIGIDRVPFVQSFHINSELPWWQFWKSR